MRYHKSVDNLKLKNKCYKGTEILFIVIFSLYIIASFFEYTLFFYDGYTANENFEFLLKMIRYLAYILIFVKIVYDRYLHDEFIVIAAVVLACIFINYYVVRDKTFVFLFLLILLSRNIKGSIIIRTHFIVTSFLLFITVLCSQIGIIQDIIADPIRNRHYLGFFWTTTGPILFLFLSLEYYYLKRGKIGICSFIIINIISLFFFVKTDTRFAFLITFLSSVLFLLLSYFPKLNRILEKKGKLLIMIPFLVALIAFAIHIKYNALNNNWNRLNELLSGRLELGNNAIKEYGIHLFGKKIEWVGFQLDGSLKGTYNYVDSSYLQIVLSFGIVLLLIVLLTYSSLLKWSYINNKYYLIWIICIILLFSVTEPRLANIVFNPFVLLIPSMEHRIRYYIRENICYQQIV